MLILYGLMKFWSGLGQAPISGENLYVGVLSPIDAIGYSASAIESNTGALSKIDASLNGALSYIETIGYAVSGVEVNNGALSQIIDTNGVVSGISTAPNGATSLIDDTVTGAESKIS